jgi:hypothetical protein
MYADGGLSAVDIAANALKAADINAANPQFKI